MSRAVRILRDVPTAALLVLSNLVPLAGVAFWGWHLGSVMVLYWLENGVIGVVTVGRMLLATFDPLPAPASEAPTVAQEPRPTNPALPAPRRHRVKPPPKPRLADNLAELTPVGFFIFHYGLFWVVHGVFVFALFGGGGPVTSSSGLEIQPVGTSIDAGAVLTGFIGLALYQVLAFVYWDVVRGEARRSSPELLMFGPYPRLVVLHVTIIVGAVLVAQTGQPIAALALLVGLKTILDLAGHVLGKGGFRVSGPVRRSRSARG